jgi:hypothetical protein
MNILPYCDVSFDFKAAKTINPIRIPPTHTPVNKNKHHLSLIVDRWGIQSSFNGINIDVSFWKVGITITF